MKPKIDDATYKVIYCSVYSAISDISVDLRNRLASGHFATNAARQVDDYRSSLLPGQRR